MNADPFADHLGDIYMQSFSGNKALGQVFTPFCLSRVCAELTFDEDKFKNREFNKLQEPTCGSGSMIIAFLKTCYEKGYNYQRYLKIDAGDLDELCVNMCYIQLSLLGARAIVKNWNGLTQEVFDAFVTPMEFLWPLTYGGDAPADAAPPAPMPQKAPETAQAAKIHEPRLPSPAAPEKAVQKAPAKRGQLSLF